MHDPNVNYFHIFLVFPLLLFISYTSLQNKPVPALLGYSLFLISLAGIAYHARRVRLGDSHDF